MTDTAKASTKRIVMSAANIRTIYENLHSVMAVNVIII